MASTLREVKARIEATKKTSQITNAMYLVSSSKVRRAEQTLHRYQEFLKRIESLAALVIESARAKKLTHPFLKPKEGKKTAYLIITSDTKLAGAYNQNVFKVLEEEMAKYENKEQFVTLSMGRKGCSYLRSAKIPRIQNNTIPVRDDVMFLDIVGTTKKVIAAYMKGEIDEIFVIYNHYINTLKQEVKKVRLLPIKNMKPTTIKREYEFEGGIEETLKQVLPIYIQSKIYGMVLDAKTAEHASRMTVMSGATDNAEKIIQELQLMYNRARQEAITNELLDIIGGASAIE